MSFSFNKLKLWLLLAILIFGGGYAIYNGFPLMFISVISFLSSLAIVFFANVIVAAILSKPSATKNVTVDKGSVIWLVSHSTLHRYVVLMVIWISQLSIVAHMLYGQNNSDGELILILFGAIISYAMISLGKRN